METKFRDGNKNIKVVTQQYRVGLYVAAYDNDSGVFLHKCCLDISEEKFHKQLREEYKDSLIN